MADVANQQDSLQEALDGVNLAVPLNDKGAQSINVVDRIQDALDNPTPPGESLTVEKDDEGNDVVETAPAVKTPTNEEEEVVEDELEDQPDETDEETVETDETDEDEVVEDENEETDDEPGELELEPEIVAEVLGLSEDEVQVSEDGELLIRTIVDGKEEFVSPKTMRDNFQFEAKLRKNSQEDAQKRRDFDAHIEAKNAEINQTIQDGTALVMFLEDQIAQVYTPEELAQMKRDDPGKWSQATLEISQNQQAVAQIKQQFSEKLLQQQKEVQEIQQRQFMDHLLNEKKLLIDKVPEWSKKEVAKPAMDNLFAGIAEAYGFDDVQALRRGTTDHRMIMIMRDALGTRAVQKKTDLVKKRLKKTPKLVKSSNRKVAKEAGKRKVKLQKRAKLKADGSVNALADVLIDRI